MTQFGIGQSVSRFEDPRLLRGQGQFVDDHNLPGQAHAVLVRSPHANARIKGINTAAARQAPGVLAVYTGDDVAADGLGTMKMTLPRKRPDGSPMFFRQHQGLSRGEVKYVGDPVALVIAETLWQAKDAAELVEVDYQPLPSVTDTEQLVAGNSPAVWTECPDNLSHIFEQGNAPAVDQAFAQARHVVKRRYVISRVFAHYMQPRGVLAQYDAGDERYTIWADVQYPHRVRNALAENIFKIPEHQIRVISHDVGGGFGTKGWQYPEHRLMPWAARKLGRPIKWTCERSEAVLADEHARDVITDAEIAFDDQGKILGLRVRNHANVGAYISSERNLLSVFINVVTLSGVYRIPSAHVRVDVLMSNCNSTAPYRGAGRPESIYAIERLLDDAATEIGIDRIELRRRNIIDSGAFPYKNPFGVTYDCGAFYRGFERMLQLCDHAGFAKRQAQSQVNGKLRGIGFANAIERAASPSQPEYVEIRFNPSGTAMVLVGTKSQGQGHETLYKQILNERLGLDPKDVKFIDGDTDRVAFGMGTNGSRSTVIGGGAAWMAAERIIEKGRKIAAHVLEASVDDIDFKAGRFSVRGTDKSMGIQQIAKTSFVLNQLPAGLEGGLYESATYVPKSETWPNGSHACEVEIDPGTGEVKVIGYWVVDDVGTMINPVGVKGQIHGGVAQGLGQALMERVVYDRESGQLLSGSFMDYAMPRAGDMPHIHIENNSVPTTSNPLGAKGAGEAGTVGALPAVMNAVNHALASVGASPVEMPATSERVWAAIERTKKA